MRGRTSSAEFVAGAACPQLGNFRAGLVATASTPGISAITGGLAAIIGTALIAVTLPAFTSYRHMQDEAEQQPGPSPAG